MIELIVDWCTGGGAASKIVVSTLLVKFELIQKHNQPFVYTLTAHFSSSAASFMCRRTISSLLCVVVVGFLLLLQCVFYQQWWWWWWWLLSSVLSLCLRCVCLLLLFSLFLCFARCFSFSHLSFSLVLSSFASHFSFPSACRIRLLLLRELRRFGISSVYVHASLRCCFDMYAQRHYCGTIVGIVRIVRVGALKILTYSTYCSTMSSSSSTTLANFYFSIDHFFHFIPTLTIFSFYL